jgi:hypothetical protein
LGGKILAVEVNFWVIIKVIIAVTKRIIIWFRAINFLHFKSTAK